ncbi:ATP-binding cassette domain-containing protein [Haloglycomyces albus]|uniref:ATP-binding cassette domain-containing protein n=1 Tax=Haloglycomyces albus TaxID=526067 RepID=UPI00046D5B84|nr:excinuclease ABC subunit UvrA [Haloglycomyces albus]
MNTAQHRADQHNHIRVQGAREHNLKNINIALPKHRLTVFTGVSGSGKSSLVFDTIAAESQRLINETYSAFLQGFMPTLARPDVDVLEGLTTAIIVDQEPMGANTMSTVGTATDANAILRILYSRIAQPHIGPPNAYSFNVPTIRASGAMTVERGNRKTEHKTYTVNGGMCPHCEGRGHITDLDLTELYDDTKTLNEGAITIPNYKPDGWLVRTITQSGYVDGNKPIRNYTKKELNDFLYREPTKIKIENTNLTYEGLIPRVKKSFLNKDPDAMQPHIRAFVDRAVTYTECPGCHGTRLNETARTSTINGKNIADACAMQINDLAEWATTLHEPTVTPLINTLQHTLNSFVEIGLGYLSLDRPTGSLSGGEAQRTKMIRHLGSPLTDITYIFDEPTAGLHPHDIQRMNTLLTRLRDKGNTVLVVEHEPETITIADHIVDLGPKAGPDGGHICFEGTVPQLTNSNTLTGQHLNDHITLNTNPRTPNGTIEIRNANTHNLKNINVDIPLGILTAVTGVAGSGKSSLIHDSMPHDNTTIAIDQSTIRGSRRSNPATYTGLLEPIRKAFAKANNVKPALFSANSKGACPACNGAGLIYTDLGMMASVTTTCEECDGKRYQPDVLNYHLGNKNISDILAMPVTEAQQFFHPNGPAPLKPAHTILTHLNDVGLGYLHLGQPLTTLSGGERQRLKLATHMKDKAGTYLLDEPTTGLHPTDVQQLLNLLDHLVDNGKTVIIIEHNQAVIAHADHIIDLGPEAGHDGGHIVFQGTPQQLIDNPTTLTGKHLADNSNT